MTRMLVIITAALALVWVPSQASRIGDHLHAMQVSAPQLPLQSPAMPDRFSGTALR
jgi:hypothetical protein